MHCDNSVVMMLWIALNQYKQSSISTHRLLVIAATLLRFATLCSCDCLATRKPFDDLIFANFQMSFITKTAVRVYTHVNSNWKAVKR